MGRGDATTCGQAGCRRAADPSAPVQLCTGHLALAADWVAGATGVVGILPAPCAACGSRLGTTWPTGTLCAVCEWRVGDVPDGELAAPRVDIVYYIRFDDRIKIGTTANPRQRLGRLWHDEVLAFERGDRVVEHARHVQFAAERQGRSEWFDTSPALLAHIALVGAGHPDPWAVYARWRSQALALRL